jgi:nitroimidazol reductase NimA-like FMN-containing flavoprotein (pyridoxamine 5'-phosphate oxidase superfamily)
VSFGSDERALLGQGLVGRLGFSAADGSPRIVPIWFAPAADELLMTTGARSFKARRLLADPRAAFEVSTFERPYKELEAFGRALVEPLEGERKLEVRRRIAVRYIPPDAADIYAALPHEVVLVRFQPARVRYFDHTRG